MGAIVTAKAPQVTAPTSSGKLTKRDLIDLVFDFENELEQYKLENTKIDLTGLDDESRKVESEKMTNLSQFEEQINSTLEEHIEELNEVKLRSLESFASVEELKSRSERNRTFSERPKDITAPLCPVLSRQLSQINSYKAYLNSSLANLEILLTKKRKEATRQQTGIKTIYQMVSNNERVLKYRESQIDSLAASLNKMRLTKSASLTPISKKSNKVFFFFTLRKSQKIPD